MFQVTSRLQIIKVTGHALLQLKRIWFRGSIDEYLMCVFAFLYIWIDTKRVKFTKLLWGPTLQVTKFNIQTQSHSRLSFISKRCWNDVLMCILVSLRTCKNICALETPFTCEFWKILMRSRLICTSDLIQSLEQIIIIPFEFNQVSRIFSITLFLLAEQIRSEMWKDISVIWYRKWWGPGLCKFTDWLAFETS